MKCVVFDFDGVIHRYREGWKDGSIYDEANEQVVELIQHILAERDDYSVCICSTRDPEQIVKWAHDKHLFPARVIHDDVKFWNDGDCVGVTNRKLPAVLYIDDRAYRYIPDNDYKSAKDFFGTLSYLM